MQELISVIVPVYQAEKTIERCVRSICESSYENLEIILVDDGSTDASKELCQKLQRRDKRINLITSKNLGVSSARNLGLRKAHGKYIGFVDADDYVHQDLYQDLFDAMSNHIDLAICGCFHCDENGNIKKKQKKAADAYTLDSLKQAFETVLYRYSSMAVWDKLYRSSIIKHNENLIVSFHEELHHYEDLLFTCEYILRSHGNITYIPHRRYYYVIQPRSLSRRYTPAIEIKNSLLYLLALMEKLPTECCIYIRLFYARHFVKLWYKANIYHYPKDDIALIQMEMHSFSCEYMHSKLTTIFHKTLLWCAMKMEFLTVRFLQVIGMIVHKKHHVQRGDSL